MSGTLAADHRHLYTAETLHYQAAFRRDGDDVAWKARIRLSGEIVGELTGVARLTASRADVLEVVRSAVDDAIDGRHFWLPDEAIRPSGATAPRSPPA